MPPKTVCVLGKGCCRTALVPCGGGGPPNGRVIEALFLSVRDSSTHTDSRQPRLGPHCDRGWQMICSCGTIPAEPARLISDAVSNFARHFGRSPDQSGPPHVPQGSLRNAVSQSAESVARVLESLASWTLVVPGSESKRAIVAQSEGEVTFRWKD